MTLRALLRAARTALDNAAEKKDGYFLGEARGYLNVALSQLEEERMPSGNRLRSPMDDK